MRFFQHLGVNLAYSDEGKGLPIVLLHAFPTDSRMWAAQVADLAADFRVITPDLRGFGQSGGNSSPLSVDAWAEDIHALLASIGALPCVLGGLSLGGYVTMAFARRYPTSLKGVMLIDTRADADSPTARDARQKLIDLARDKGGAGIAEQMTPKLLAPGAAEHRPDLVRKILEMAEGITRDSLELIIAALRDRPDSTSLLPTIRVPALVMVGDGDQITPVAIAEQMRIALPDSALAVIRGAGHLCAIEQPSQVNQAIRAFVTRVSNASIP